jgi:hypothetical protein
MTQKLNADLERDEVRGMRDRSEMNWEGEAPAEPRTTANSEWRVANSERRLAISDWRLVETAANGD